MSRSSHISAVLFSFLVLWYAGSPHLGAQSLRVTHFAGTAGGGGFLDGPGSVARFDSPISAAVDSSGNVYVGDSSSYIVRKINPSGVVTTLAGSPGVPASVDGTGSAARFAYLTGVATDSAGNIYVASSGDETIRKITPAGVVTTLAGLPYVSGTADGTGSAARFKFPVGIATDSASNIYVADSESGFEKGAHTIRKITPAGAVTTLAGSPGITGSSDGAGSAARFDFRPYSGALTTDSAGNVYVADTNNNTIRKITPAGVVTTLAGVPGAYGLIDGTGNGARFGNPQGIAADSAGNLYVVDGGSVIRRVTPAGVVTTLAGTPFAFGFVDGIGSAARFNFPRMLTCDGANLYVPDQNNNAVRKVVIATAQVTTLAGGSPVEFGSVDGLGAAARFLTPSGLGTDGTNLYVADSQNSTIRKIVLATGQVTTFAGTPGVIGSADGVGSAASFHLNVSTFPTYVLPSSLATDGTGLFVPDTGNSTIRRIALATGQVTTLAGTPGIGGSADGIGSAARFNSPTGITTDGTNLYVVDLGNATIRKVVISSGAVTTLAGSPGSIGSVDGVGSAARFTGPRDVTIDGGNLYVADQGDSTIRKIVLATGQVTTMAGAAGLTGSSDGIGTAARFNGPSGLATDGTRLYVSDSLFSGTIRSITLSTGKVTTIAGSPVWAGGMDGIGATALFFNTRGLAFANNTLFIADLYTNGVRQGVCVADAPVGPTISPVGNPTGPVTGIDFLNLKWSPPASGDSNSYDFAINGDAFANVGGSSATAPPRNSSNPITLHVRGRACTPEAAGTAVDSPTYSPSPPVASFTASVSGKSVTVTDTSKPQATAWLWLWGDGSFDTVQAPPAHTYSVAGDYPIVLIATNGAGSSSSMQRAQTLAISVPLNVKALLRFEGLDPGRSRLGGITIAGPRSTWLRIAPVGDEDVIVYLRFLDGAGNLVEERRLAPSAGTESIYDIGAYGLSGKFTLELVSDHGLEAALLQTAPNRRDAKGDDDGHQ